MTSTSLTNLQVASCRLHHVLGLAPRAITGRATEILCVCRLSDCVIVSRNRHSERLDRTLGHYILHWS